MISFLMEQWEVILKRKIHHQFVWWATRQEPAHCPINLCPAANIALLKFENSAPLLVNRTLWIVYISGLLVRTKLIYSTRDPNYLTYTWLTSFEFSVVKQLFQLHRAFDQIRLLLTLTGNLFENGIKTVIVTPV